MNGAQPAIEDHAIIGDLSTVALVDTQGTVDFFCLPRLDGPSVFASLLDARAGRFSIRVDDAHGRTRQVYVPDTNIVLTQFLGAGGVAELADFLVIGTPRGEPVMVRQVRAIRGRVRVNVSCEPRFDYARAAHEAVLRDGGVDFAPANDLAALRLIADVPLEVANGSATAAFDLDAGESRAFVLGTRGEDLPATTNDVAAYAGDRFARTADFWRSWSAKSTYRGRWREIVMRSALTLKLLVSQDHGSIAAAATFGLPEAFGAGRNWDYRYSWIRDASFAVYAFLRLGYVQEALAFMDWIGVAVGGAEHSDPIRPMYRLDGSPDLPEVILPNVHGYRGARPVRIGNAAAAQLQLDGYGALMDAVYLTSKYGGALSLDAWSAVSRHTDWLCEHWQEADEGIWESRNGRRPYLHSRVMCWVAVDRAIRLADKRSLPAPFERWNAVRSRIHASIVNDFWNADLQSFVRTAGGVDVDASALMLPLVRFISARDPRWRTTQARIEATLVRDAFVYRYTPGDRIDGLAGDEGAFTTCSFWLVECLVRSGEVERARLVFEKLLAFGNHVGLFAEEFGPVGEQLGNFPQSLTHLALISAAVALDRALTRESTPWQ